LLPILLMVWYRDGQPFCLGSNPLEMDLINLFVDDIADLRLILKPAAFQDVKG